MGVLWVSGCSGKQGSALSGRTNKNGTLEPVLPGTGGIAGAGGLLVPESLVASSGGVGISVLQADTQETNKRLIKVDSKYQTNQGLVEIREKMFIAQTNDVYLNPEEYLGKTIKLEGIFQTQSYSNTESPYYFVIRYGPGCCGNDGNAGFEVMWDQVDAVYPGENDWVEAIGVLGAYEEDGYPYICINLSSLKVLGTRGQEFVTQ
jgi:uncharacterized membrane protein YcgQ (UPF0703/DUF1980 family)